jgi:hypothetical protein
MLKIVRLKEEAKLKWLQDLSPRDMEIWTMLRCEVAGISGRKKRDFLKDEINETYTELNSVALARKRTITTERPQHVVEGSANFFG